MINEQKHEDMPYFLIVIVISDEIVYQAFCSFCLSFSGISGIIGLLNHLYHEGKGKYDSHVVYVT